MKRSNISVGLLFIIIGLFAFTSQRGLLQNLEFDAGQYLGPLLLIGMGLAFELAFFTRRTRPGFLVPGGIFLVGGSVLLFEVITYERYREYVAPLYILAVVAGLLQMYFFGKRKKGLLIASVILSIISACAFISVHFRNTQIENYAVPILLIGLGILSVFRSTIPAKTEINKFES